MLQCFLQCDPVFGLVLEKLVNQVLGLLRDHNAITVFVGALKSIGQDLRNCVVVEGEGPCQPESNNRYIK